MATVPSTVSPAAACYRATVQSRDATNTYWVTIDGNQNLYPARMIESWVWPLVTTSSGGSPAHTHGAGHIIANGDRLAVIPVAGNISDLLIIGRLT
jgi:hypothetical protein